MHPEDAQCSACGDWFDEDDLFWSEDGEGYCDACCPPDLEQACTVDTQGGE